jgi:putative transposase
LVIREDVSVPAPHPPEFRRRAVELGRAGDKPVAEVAKDLGISESCLRNWMRQAEVDDDGSAMLLTSARRRSSPSCGVRIGSWRWRIRSLSGPPRPSLGRTFSQSSLPLVRELADDGVDVAVACRVLTVSRSGYYEWCTRPPSARDEENELLLKHIRAIHAESRGTYGWPRVHAELTPGLGLPVNRKRVARLMRQAGIQGLYRRRRHGCTVRDPGAEPAGDLVNRQFAVGGPNRLWGHRYHRAPDRGGKVYCAAVMDAYSRLIIGWSIAEHMRTKLVTDALGMAILRRKPDDGTTILHSDHGTQPMSWAFGQRLRPAYSPRWAPLAIVTTIP